MSIREERKELTESELIEATRRNNPNGERSGPFTGRCHRCGSKDLWDDDRFYGCNFCGGLYRG